VYASLRLPAIVFPVEVTGAVNVSTGAHIENRALDGKSSATQVVCHFSWL